MVAGTLMFATASATTSDRWNLPIATKKLDNGLVVVVSEDHSSPTVGISVVYKVGIRTEPRGRTGFAHLFEHLMFEGTPNAPQGVFDRVTADGGGDNNGSTHPDFTSYIERAPVSALEPLLWLEADRMKTLAFDQESLDGQRDVVKEEIRVNVLNQPYGGFSETDLPLLAFAKWENSHDGYGSFDDLDKAALDDVRAFHRDFYGPNNAVLGIAGDVTPEQGFALARKYFGAIPARVTPAHPDVDEPLNTAEKRLIEGDGLAKLPALAVGWKMPKRGSPDQAAMIVLGELLAGGGDASRLYQALVKGSALAVQVGDFTGSGSPWEFDGPTLYTVIVIHKVPAKADDVLAAIDAQVGRIAREGVDPETLQAVKTRLLADWYDDLEPFVDRAERLAILQALWGDAGIANRVPDLIDAVTPADLQRVAAAYLTHGNRSIIERVPDFMLDGKNPARSDLRAKAKAKPAKPAGKVSVGNPQSVQPASTPASQPATVPPTKQTPPASAPVPIPAPPVSTPPSLTQPASMPASPPPPPASVPASQQPAVPSSQAPQPVPTPAVKATQPVSNPVPSPVPTTQPATAPVPEATSPASPTASPLVPTQENTAPAAAVGPTSANSAPAAAIAPAAVPGALAASPVPSKPGVSNATLGGKDKTVSVTTGSMPEPALKPKNPAAKPDASTVAKRQGTKPVSEGVKPQSAKPQSAKPQSAKPQSAKPQSAKSESAKPQIAKPENAKPESAKPQSAKSDAAAASPASPGSPASDASSGKP